MIDLSKLSYRLITITPEGRQLDLTDCVINLSWSENERELGSKINFKIASNAVADLQPLMPVIVLYNDGTGFREVIRGSVQKMQFNETSTTLNCDVTAYDEAQALRQSQSDYYFSPDSSTTSILEKILSDAGVEYKIEIDEDAKHAKKVFRANYLSDMIQDILKDCKEKTGKEYFLRAKEGVIEIIPRGTNETIFHFDIMGNVVSVKEDFDASKVVTRVKVVGKENSEGKQHVDSIVEGNTELGVRQRIYQRGNKETLEEAEKSARKILDEQGAVERKTTIEATDLPALRKGDRVRVKSSLGENYFFVSSIRHSNGKMTLQLSEDKEKNKELGIDYDTAWSSTTKDD